MVPLHSEENRMFLKVVPTEETADVAEMLFSKLPKTSAL